jgi:hypothetical protein
MRWEPTMTNDALDRRLRELGRQSRAWMDGEEGRTTLAERARLARREAVVDMSDEAVERRLRRLAGVSALCCELARSQARPPSSD